MSSSVLAGLRRLRWAVRSVLGFGLAASIAANVLHARPNPISQTISAWPPLALLLTVELVSRVPMHRPLLAGVRVLSTTVIAAIAGWVSYWHMQAVAVRYGENPTSAYLLPVSVDGLIVVCSICLVELAGRIRTLEYPTAEATPPRAHPAPVPPAAAVDRGPTDAAVANMAEHRDVATGSQVTARSHAEAGGHVTAQPAGRGHADTAHIPADTAHIPADDSAGLVVGNGRRAGVGPRNPASRARKATAAAKATRPPAAARSDEELLAQLATMSRDEDGSVSVRRAATALGTGAGRARRLLTQAGLRQPTTAGGTDGR